MDQTKPWYTSQTIWASLMTVCASLAAAFGHQISPDIINEAVVDVSQIVTALSGLWALKGRITATAKISG